MSADVLRAAATRPREAAEAATRPDEMHPYGDRTLPPFTIADWPRAMDNYLGGTWGEFAGLMSPPVAVHMADWLDYTARIADEDEFSDGEDPHITAALDACDCPYCIGIPLAVNVAHAVLGTTP